jgi:hypothetical protein
MNWSGEGIGGKIPGTWCWEGCAKMVTAAVGQKRVGLLSLAGAVAISDLCSMEMLAENNDENGRMTWTGKDSEEKRTMGKRQSNDGQRRSTMVTMESTQHLHTIYFKRSNKLLQKAQNSKTASRRHLRYRSLHTLNPPISTSAHRYNRLRHLQPLVHQTVGLFNG